MDDEYNVISGFDDQELSYPDQDDNTGDTTVLSELNGDGRRKRRLEENFEGLPTDEHYTHPIDWHMRVPITLEEREAKRQKFLMEEEIVERLSAQIVDLRQRNQNAHRGPETSSEEEHREKRQQVMRTPPIDGSPWLGISGDGSDERFYIRLSRVSRSPYQPCFRANELRKTMLNLRSSTDLIREASEIRANHANRPQVISEHETAESGSVSSTDGLWVNKYSPKTFAELLSDDGINRNLLTWLKLWDECVFRKKINMDNLVEAAQKEVYTLDSGRPRRPTHKVVLLSGPAGLGKTTLAGVVARHAGYATVEVNASDSRNVADFERVLDGAARCARSIDGSGGIGRPNCLIIDEIDGSPAEAIRFLVRALQEKGKKAIRRPIICICNNLFTPSLRDLRGIALSIQMTATRQDRLIDRLEQIASLERVRIHRGPLTRLAELCRCDVRLSLNILQFMSSVARNENRTITSTEVQQAVERETSGAASIFDNWASVLNYSKHLDCKGLLLSERLRIQRIDRLVSDCGDDRFVSGLHSNFIRLPLPLGILRRASLHFLYYDRIMLMVHERQNYSLMRYLVSFYASLHLTVATHSKVSMKYPTLEQTISQRARESSDTMTELRSRLTVRCTPVDLIRDIVPMLVTIVQPPIKPMNEYLYTKRELAQIQSVVEVMVGYNLTFAPNIVNSEVHYTFQPAIDVLTLYNLADVSHRFAMPSTTRHMIVRKIDQFRIQHTQNLVGLPSQAESAVVKTNTKKIIELAEGGGASKKDRMAVPLHFKFNQGFSNAVKRNIRMCHIAL